MSIEKLPRLKFASMRLVCDRPPTPVLGAPVGKESRLKLNSSVSLEASKGERIVRSGPAGLFEQKGTV